MAGLIAHAQTLAAANKSASAAKKTADIAKENIANWLAENRAVTIKDLPIGETVSFADCNFLIRIDSQNRFNESAFASTYPELYLQFKTDKPVIKYLV